MAPSFTRLSTFPRHRLVEEEVARCRASELDLLGVFGEPASQTPADDPDPTFFWDVEWSCGLVMDLQYHQLTETLALRLDQPDVAHALRHLGFEVRELWVLEVDDPERLATLASPLDRSWTLWERAGGGADTEVAAGLTERDARCWEADLLDDGGDTHVWVTGPV